MAVNCNDYYRDSEGQWWQNVPPVRRIKPSDVPPECRGAGIAALALKARAKPPKWMKPILMAKAKVAAEKVTARKRTSIKRATKKKAAKRVAKKPRA
jgi:hypothetical protein